MKLLIITSAIIVITVFVIVFGLFISNKVINEADELENQE